MAKFMEVVQVKNIKQGTVWDISDPEHLARLKKNPDYEIVGTKGKGKGKDDGPDNLT